MEQGPHNSRGRIILLNGASSSGKSSIARELQRQLPTPFLHLSIDHLRDSGVLPLERFRSRELHLGRDAREFLPGFERAVAAFAGAGNDLIVDYIIETREWLERIEGVLSDCEVLLVGVHCPLEELERREAGEATARWAMLAETSSTVHEHCATTSRSMPRYRLR